MGKVLVIAEKPDAGRNMAKVLKCDNCKDGYIENEKYIVTWAVGHLIGLKMPEEHNSTLKEWKMSTLPLIFDIDDSLNVDFYSGFVYEMLGIPESFTRYKKTV